MRKTTSMILAALFAALTAVGAFLRIPTPVSSFTLQTLFTAMAAVLLGRRWGAVSQIVYVLLGLAGLPVFTNGGGLGSVLQPTFGFLLGLPPMAWVIGFMTERWGTTFGSICLACLVGTGVLYLIGLPYMHGILAGYLNRDWSFWQTLVSGMLLFLPTDLLKIGVTALLCSKLAPRLSHSL